MSKVTLLLIVVVATTSITAQDYRNNLFGGSRTASYQQHITKRGNVVAAIQPRLEPFYHGVASGDPTSTSVIIWTRVTPRNSESHVPVTWVIAADTSFATIITSGTAIVSSENDFCLSVDVKGLQPATTYYYNFRAYDRNSLTGRTKTTPIGSYDHARIGVVTCSNYPAGFFNAYGRLAARNDIDVVLHMGDYIYEYAADSSSYSGVTGHQLGRSHEPNKELIELVDYRTRYAQYRLDPDLIRLHQQHPMIHVWDDHESANDAYSDGAQNHSPDEGSWNQRKEVSKRVHAEWMPVRSSEDGNIYRSVSLGDLANIIMLDTRLEGRNKQVQGYLKNATQMQKDSLNDPSRTIISQTQFDWLTSRLVQSHQWNVMGSQVMFTPVQSSPIDTNYLFEVVGPVIAGVLRPQLDQLQDLFDGAFNGDTWSNYPAQRSNLVEVLNDASVGRTVIVSGDFHTSFAFTGNWPQQTVDAVEFMTPSITSSNFDENLASAAFLAIIAQQLVKSVDTTIQQLNEHVSYMDLTNHGYMILDLQREQVQSDWFFVDTLYLQTTNERWAQGRISTDGKTLRIADRAAPEKQFQDIVAPTEPRAGVTGLLEDTTPEAVLGFGPVPTNTTFYITLVSDQSSLSKLSVVDNKGNLILTHDDIFVEAGLTTVTLDLQSVASGTFHVLLNVGRKTYRVSGIIQR